MAGQVVPECQYKDSISEEPGSGTVSDATPRDDIHQQTTDSLVRTKVRRYINHTVLTDDTHTLCLQTRDASVTSLDNFIPFTKGGGAGLMWGDQARGNVEDCASSINPITVRLSYYRNERLEWESSLVYTCLVPELERWWWMAGRLLGRGE